MNNNNFRRKRKLFILIPIALVFGLSAVVMWLWNTCLVAAIAGISIISYWQAMGLLILSKILFGGFPGKGRQGGRHCNKKTWLTTGENLSDEEKEQFKSMWKARFDRKFESEK